MKKMLNLVGTVVIAGSSTGLATTNSTIEQINNNIEGDKTFQIEPVIISNNALRTAEVDYQTEKINLTMLKINTLDELKGYYVVSLPNFEIAVNGDKVDTVDYFQ